MSNDLISREALKEDFKSRLALCNEWIEKAKDKETKIRASAVKAFIAEVIMTIDNAPAIDLVSPTIKVNIPEETKQKLIEELQKPHKLLVLPEPEITFERPQGEWGKWVISEIQCPNCFEYFQTDCYSTEELKKCPNCGADMKGGAE